MQKQDIIITIGPDGEVSFTIKGAKGKSCINETKFLEEALGGEVQEREFTAEYYESGAGNYQSSYSGGEESDD